MKKFTLLVLLTLLSAPNLLAWDEVGHKVAAYIAWQRLDPQIREDVTQILLDAPEDSHLNVLYDRFNSRSEETKRRELFMHSSIWPDVVRNQDFVVRHEKYNRSNWHYAGIFWKGGNGRAEILEDFPGAGGIAIEKLYEFEKILRDECALPEEKAVAIAWFLHVGADIHNPLHNASRVTELEEEGDRGGNLFVFRPRTEESFGLNLHGFWDSIVSRVKPRKDDACDVDYVEPIARKFMKKHPFRELDGELKLGDYKAWNREGFEQLPTVVYTNEIVRNQMPPDRYVKRTFNVARRNLALSGYRLGETINRIFRKSSQPSPKGN